MINDLDRGPEDRLTVCWPWIWWHKTARWSASGAWCRSRNNAALRPV